MMTLYLVAAMVGLGLIIFTAIAGGHDTHVDHDLTGDAGIHWDDIGLAPFLSLRFWTYFAATFGLTGAVLSLMRAPFQQQNLIASLVGGFVVGLAVHFAMRALRRSESSSAAHVDDLIGREGKLLVGIREGQPGKVRLDVKGDLIDMLALPESGKTAEAGETVYVLAIENDRAIVARREDLLEN
ncbi:MAG: hypothetical protein HONBIEJF_01792 [Fimbriimonadaceae bacterium]|nr:hypothetical protein [Fimbriimonadaceae bacterium]